MTDLHEAIAALIDGESVDPERLKRALSDEEGREYLIDLLALRELVNDASVTGVASSGPAVRPLGSKLRWLAAAAAMVLVSVLAGYVAGQRTARSLPQAGNPVVVTTVAPPPPAPTRVIRLQPGVDWQERTGGH